LEEAKKRKEKKRKGLRESLGEDMYICSPCSSESWGWGWGWGWTGEKGRDTGGWGLGFLEDMCGLEYAGGWSG